MCWGVCAPSEESAFFSLIFVIYLFLFYLSVVVVVVVVFIYSLTNPCIEG